MCILAFPHKSSKTVILVCLMIADPPDFQECSVPVRKSSYFCSNISQDQAVAYSAQCIRQVTSVNSFTHYRSGMSRPLILSLQSTVQSLFEKLCCILACKSSSPATPQLHALTVKAKLIASTSDALLSESMDMLQSSVVKLFMQITTNTHPVHVSMIAVGL
jgi:hypothetical protein